ncbi:MAG: zinc ribbon domain-containing protein [Thomasclavelia sp.]|nr:zinc ribbon domain-containing protein [Thomasclavelia sp.]
METALSRKVFCGECGSTYRREIYMNRDKTIRSIEWKCSKASDGGKTKYPGSRAIKEEILLQTIMEQFNVNFNCIRDKKYFYNNKIVYVINKHIGKIDITKDGYIKINK